MDAALKGCPTCGLAASRPAPLAAGGRPMAGESGAVIGGGGHKFGNDVSPCEDRLPTRAGVYGAAP